MRKHFYITQHYQRTRMSQSNKIQTISTLFPQELWGNVKLDTPEERAAHFNKLWCEWKDTEIELPRGDTTMVATRYEYLDAKHITRKFANKYKLKEFWDYQLRRNTIRFRDEHNAMLFKLSL